MTVPADSAKKLSVAANGIVDMRGDTAVLAGTFAYDGRGYDDPRASEVAELLHRARTEVRKVAREQRVISRGISQGESL